jgi:hypothetical protein
MYGMYNIKLLAYQEGHLVGGRNLSRGLIEALPWRFAEGAELGHEKLR